VSVFPKVVRPSRKKGEREGGKRERKGRREKEGKSF